MLIVLDANELFAALISRGLTLDLFFSYNLELVSPDFLAKEFAKHKDEIIKKSGLSKEDIDIFFFLLIEKIKFFSAEDFSEFLQEANSISPDQDDVEYFALALKLNCPIWSEDKELKKQNRIRVISTSELIKLI